ncbi:MAG TPA: DUF3858 domain-containing protein, partial [Anseongella sp.]|nr:DUF3858 domain-containing protein [Anseongella sp.]
YPLNNMFLDDWKVTQQKEGEPLTKELLRFQARDFASFSGGRLFLTLNPLNRIDSSPRPVPERRTPVFIRESYTEEDSYRFTLPQAYSAEYMPAGIEIDRPFGHFSLSLEKEGELLVYKRTLRLKKGTYPPAIYDDLTAFFQQVQKSDLQKLVLSKE